MSINPELLRQMMVEDGNAITQLKALLVRERELLTTRDHQQLSKILEQKLPLVDLLNSHAQIRQQILRNQGLSTNASGWHEFLQRNPQTQALCDGWNKLIGEFSECQALNSINGKLITRSGKTIDHLLNLLRGKAPAPSLYTANGNRTQQNHSYSLAKA